MRFEQIPHASPLYTHACALRDAVLRVPIGLRLSEQDVAGEDSQLHIAALDDAGAVLGTVILKPLTPSHFKLRQMAVAASAQGQGLGARLVQYAESVVGARGVLSIECNARMVAVGFYEKLGYHCEGEPFTEVGLPTIRMVKIL